MSEQKHTIRKPKVCMVLSTMEKQMACDFLSFSLVFQSYTDHERMIMKGCMKWNPNAILQWEDSHPWWISNSGLLAQQVGT